MAHLHAHARFRWLAAALVLAGLVLLSATIASAKDRGWWDSTEVQVLNLDPVPATFTAHLINVMGVEVYAFADTLPPLGTQIYKPEEMEPPLPPGFSGVLSIESEQNIAATILHHDETPGGLFDGNTTFEVADTSQTSDPIWFPVDVCTIILIHNANPHAASTLTAVYDENGSPLLAEPRFIMSDTTTLVILSNLLPSLVGGAGVIESDSPIEVTILHSCLGIVGGASYLPAATPSTHWLLPRVLPGGIGQEGLSLIGLANPSSTLPVSVTLRCPCGSTVTYVLPPHAGWWVTAPAGAVAGPLSIKSDGPVAASVLTQYDLLEKAQEPPGDYMYGAANAAQASPAVALPVLLRDYEGWSTDGGIYIQNLGLDYANMHLRYITVDGIEYYDEALVAPGMVWTPLPPPITFQHAAAVAWADQPISALVTARKQGTLDGWMGYRGINFAPPAKPDASFTATPQAGCQPLEVQFNDTSQGNPIGWLWELGDGTVSTLQNPAHFYPEAGIYTVTMTAFNYAGSDTATGTVTVYETPVAAFTHLGGAIRTGTPVQFIDTSSGQPGAWEWQFSDGGYYTVPDPVHTFTATGVFSIRLTVTTTLGCTDTTAQNVTVLPPGALWRIYVPIVVKGG